VKLVRTDKKQEPKEKRPASKPNTPIKPLKQPKTAGTEPVRSHMTATRGVASGHPSLLNVQAASSRQLFSASADADAGAGVDGNVGSGAGTGTGAPPGAKSRGMDEDDDEPIIVQPDLTLVRHVVDLDQPAAIQVKQEKGAVQVKQEKDGLGGKKEAGSK